MGLARAVEFDSAGPEIGSGIAFRLEQATPGQDKIDFLCLMVVHRVEQSRPPITDKGAAGLRPENAGRAEQLDMAIMIEEMPPDLRLAIGLDT